MKMQAPPVRKGARTVAETRGMGTNNRRRESRQVFGRFSSGEEESSKGAERETGEELLVSLW
jgi:hypothetical protein